MKSIRRLGPIHSYQLGFTLSGIIAMAGLLLGAWTALPALGIVLVTGLAAGYGIDRLANPAVISRSSKQKARKRSASRTKYIPKDGPAGKGKASRQAVSTPSPAITFMRQILQWTASLPGQLLTLVVLSSLAFFIFIQLSGKSSLSGRSHFSGSAVSSKEAFFCEASIQGVEPEQIDSSQMGQYEYALKEDSCRAFDDYVQELTPGSGSSEAEMRQEVCRLTEEALMSSMRKIQHFEDIQFVISGDVGNLRAYNMDVFSKYCTAP